MRSLARVLRRWADRLDGGQRPAAVVLNQAIDPKTAGREIRKVLLDLKRSSGGGELGLR